MNGPTRSRNDRRVQAHSGPPRFAVPQTAICTIETFPTTVAGAPELLCIQFYLYGRGQHQAAITNQGKIRPRSRCTNFSGKRPIVNIIYTCDMRDFLVVHNYLCEKKYFLWPCFCFLQKERKI